MAENFSKILLQIKEENQKIADKKTRDDDLRHKEDESKLEKLITEQQNFYKLTDKNGKKLNDMRTKETKLAKLTLDNSIKDMEESKLIRQEQKDFRSKEKKDIDLQKSALESLKLAIEQQGGKAEENTEYNKETLKLQLKEFSLRKKLAGSASAKEEIDKEQKAATNKQGTFLQKIASGISGIGANMKEKALSAGKGLFSIIKGTLFAGLLLAFAAFLKSPAFGEMIDFIKKEIVPTLIKVYKFLKENIFKFFKDLLTFVKDPSWENFKKFDLMSVITTLGTITALLAPRLLFKGLLGSVKLFGKAIAFAATSLSNTSKDVDTKTKTKKPGGKLSMFKNVGKVGLKAAKFIPGVGLAVTAISGLFDGITAGMKEAEKENSTKLSILKEASAGVLSGLTFGLVDQSTFSDAFTSVGDKFSKGIDTMKNSTVEMYDKYIGPDAEWAKTLSTSTSAAVETLKTNASEMFNDLPTLGDIGLKLTEGIDGIKNNLPTFDDIGVKFSESITGIKGMFNDLPTFDDIGVKLTEGIDGIKDKLPSFDEIGTKLNGFADDVKNKFTSITGITIPSFDDVQKGLSNLGSSLSEKFKGITGIDLGDKFDKLKDMLPDIGNPFSGILKSLNESSFFKDAKMDGFSLRSPLASVKGIIKTALSDLFDIQTAERGGSVSAAGMVLVGERGPEIMRMGNQPGQIMSAERTNQMMKSGNGGSSSSPIIINAPTNTNAPTNNNSTNVTSSTFVEPDAMFRRNTQFAI